MEQIFRPGKERLCRLAGGKSRRLDAARAEKMPTESLFLVEISIMQGFRCTRTSSVAIAPEYEGIREKTMATLLFFSGSYEQMQGIGICAS